MCCHMSGGLLPHLFTLTSRAALEDVSQVSLLDATELRSAGGLFSVALSVTSSTFVLPIPWRYQARCPLP
jgi:hypothetical protein